jgi:hypothetical protein
VLWFFFAFFPCPKHSKAALGEERLPQQENKGVAHAIQQQGPTEPALNYHVEKSTYSLILKTYYEC